jgi:hypothetical protein
LPSHGGERALEESVNVALWIVQGALALVFGGSGIVKATRDRKRLFDDGITWVEDFPAAAVKAIGVLVMAAAAFVAWGRFGPYAF